MTLGDRSQQRRETPSRICFSRAGILTGFAAGQALAAGVFAFGVAFGVLATEAGLSSLEATLMSGVIYSGSAQLAVLQGWPGEPLILPAVVTILMMNARYLLYGAALRPWLAPLPCHSLPSSVLSRRWQLGAFDEAIRGERTRCRIRVGLGAADVCLVADGNDVGTRFRKCDRYTRAVWPRFQLVAFSTALAIDFCKARADILPAVAALAVAILCNHVAPSGWTIVAAGLAGATVAFFLRRDTSNERQA